MNVLLATTVLIDALRGREECRRSLRDLLEGGHKLTISTLNIGEVYSGMHPEEEPKTKAFLTALECFTVSESIARRAGRLKFELSRRGHTSSLADMIVASTALEHKLALMTANRRHFPLDELRFYPAVSP